MYDLKVNYAFMPHKRDTNKPAVGVTMLPGIIVDRVAGQV